MKPNLCLTAVVLCGLVANAAQAEVPMAIYRIWQDFTTSHAAAMACGGGDQATEDRFQGNLDAVTSRTIQLFQQTNPSLTPDAAASRVQAAGNRLTGRINAIVGQQGCGSMEVQQLLRMYKMNARMNIAGNL